MLEVFSRSTESKIPSSWQTTSLAQRRRCLWPRWYDNWWQKKDLFKGVQDHHHDDDDDDDYDGDDDDDDDEHGIWHTNTVGNGARCMVEASWRMFQGTNVKYICTSQRHDLQILNELGCINIFKQKPINTYQLVQHLRQLMYTLYVEQ